MEFLDKEGVKTLWNKVKELNTNTQTSLENYGKAHYILRDNVDVLDFTTNAVATISQLTSFIWSQAAVYSGIWYIHDSSDNLIFLGMVYKGNRVAYVNGFARATILSIIQGGGTMDVKNFSAYITATQRIIQTINNGAIVQANV